MTEFFNKLQNLFTVPDAASAVVGAFLYFSRFLLPFFAVAIIVRCARSMLRQRYEPEVWAYIDLPDGARVPLRSWECTVGGGRSCDVFVGGRRVGNPQLVLIRDEGGNWLVHNLGKGDIARINGGDIDDAAPLRDGDTLEIDGQELLFYNLTERERDIVGARRTAPGGRAASGAVFGYISAFQLIVLFQLLVNAAPENRAVIALAFAALFIVMWLYFIIMRISRRRGLEVEALAFFLSTIGLSVAATCAPEAMPKQVILILAGIAMFLLFGAWLRDLRRVAALRLTAAILAGALLAVNLAFGLTQFGAKNWLVIGGFTFQPSEFVKIVFIYAGAATMDRLYHRRNLLIYIGFSAACVGALALMGDFGTALVFFMTFLVISFLRSGNFATVALSLTGAGLAGMLAISAKPYIAERFALWGHAWEDVHGAGYQQTRAMSALAGGGLFGSGAGGGWLHKIVAAETDLAFEVASEELGFIVALCAVIAIVIMAVFVVKNAASARSSFYVIAGVGAVSMLMVQMAFNVFGSLDLLPFTGVTLPFVSMGGSSLISCWVMIAFIKATDTRKNSSFVVKAPGGIHDSNEFTEPEEYADEETEAGDEEN